MSQAVVAAYLACALIWGTTWYAIRVCIGPGGFGTLDALALRFVIAIVVLIPIALRSRPWPRGAQWGWLVLAGVLDAAGYVLVYLGEEHVPGAVAAVLYGTQPLILAVFLTVTGMETITRRHVIGALVSLAGVAVLFLDRLDVSAQQAVGVGMVLGSVVIATTYSMIMKRHTANVHAAVTTTVFLVVTAAVLGVVALVAGGGDRVLVWPPPLVPTAALLYLALIGSVVAFLTYFWLLQRTSLLVTSTLVFVYPLVAIATDALFEAETLTARAYVGAAITLGGLGVSLRRSRPVSVSRGRIP
ncbi:MAG: EamA family transporter [Myxococcales bacterium]|nr:EamA family transporter [Myxococcales bacterium]